MDFNFISGEDAISVAMVLGERSIQAVTEQAMIDDRPYTEQESYLNALVRALAKLVIGHGLVMTEEDHRIIDHGEDHVNTAEYVHGIFL